LRRIRPLEAYPFDDVSSDAILLPFSWHQEGISKAFYSEERNGTGNVKIVWHCLVGPVTNS